MNADDHELAITDIHRHFDTEVKRDQLFGNKGVERDLGGRKSSIHEGRYIARVAACLG